MQWLTFSEWRCSLNSAPKVDREKRSSRYEKKSEDVTEKITSPPDFHISTMEAWLLKSLVKTAITTKGHFFPILVRTQATLLPYSFFCATELDIFQFSIDIIPYTSIVVVYNQPGWI